MAADVVVHNVRMVLPEKGIPDSVRRCLRRLAEYLVHCGDEDFSAEIGNEKTTVVVTMGIKLTPGNLFCVDVKPIYSPDGDVELEISSLNEMAAAVDLPLNDVKFCNVLKEVSVLLTHPTEGWHLELVFYLDEDPCQ